MTNETHGTNEKKKTEIDDDVSLFAVQPGEGVCVWAHVNDVTV